MTPKGAETMAKRTRRNHGGVFKAKVALGAVKRTLAENSTAFTDPTQTDYDVEEAAFRQGIRGLR